MAGFSGFSQQRQTGGTVSTATSSRNSLQHTRMENMEEEVYDFLGDTQHLEVAKLEKVRIRFEMIKKNIAELDTLWKEAKRREKRIRDAKMLEERKRAELIEEIIKIELEIEKQKKARNSPENKPVKDVIVISDSDDDYDDDGIIEVIGPYFPAKKPNLAPKRKRRNINVQAQERLFEDDSQDKFEFVIRWRWKMETTHILKKYQTFQHIFQRYADMEKADIKNVSMETRDGRLIFPGHTPESMGLRNFELLTGVVLADGTLPSMDELYGNEDGRLPIKLQLKNRKQNMKIRVKPEAPLMKLMFQAAEMLEKNVKKLKFYFDGERVNPRQSASELGLEGDEIFDLLVDE